MATAPRPGSTPNSNRAAAEAAHITIKIGDDTYTMRPGELSALDSAELRKQTGLSVRLLMAAAVNDPDLDVVAAIAWLARRQAGDRNEQGRPYTFQEIAAEIGYDTAIEQVDEPTEDEGSPEA